MIELATVFLLLMSAGMFGLVLLAGLEKAVRRRRHSPTAGVTPSATSSLRLSQAERQRAAFERIQADLIREAESQHLDRLINRGIERNINRALVGRSWGRDTSGKRYDLVEQFLADLHSHRGSRS